MNATEAVQRVFLSFGEAWVLWLLAVLSIASLALVVERWIFYRSVSGDPEALSRALDGKLAEGDTAGAIGLLSRSRAVAASVASAGLRLAPRGPSAVEKAMQSALALERSRLERRLAFLGTLGNNAPFVGLFGTVVGVLHAFESLAHTGHSHGGQAAAGVASQALMGSIAEALVATAVGILVALPAVAAYNYFQRRVASLLAGTEVLSNLVLAYLGDHAQRKAA